MKGMGSTTEESAKAARRHASYRLKGGAKSGGTSALEQANQDRLDRASVKAKEKRLSLRIELVALIREFGRKPFSLIDQILGLPPGTSRETYEKHNDAYKAWTKKYASEALHRFYKDQITVLELLSRSTPEAVELWTKTVTDPTAKRADRERAAKEVFQWTKLFLSTKEGSNIRDVIPKALLEAHDEAEKLGGHLQMVLGSSLDTDRLPEGEDVQI